MNGRLEQREYQTQQGEKRTVIEVNADEVAPSLRYATAQVERTTSGAGGAGGASGGNPGGSSNAGANRGGTAPRGDDNYYGGDEEPF